MSEAAQDSQDSREPPKPQEKTGPVAFKLPSVFKPRPKFPNLTEVDQQGVTTLGIQELLSKDFSSTGSSSEVSLSTYEGRRGFDLSWYQDNLFKLFVVMTMDPIDVFASSDDFLFNKDSIESSIQQGFELQMSKVSSLNRCFVNVKATSTRQAERFLTIPLKVVMITDDRGNAKEVILEACPPQNKHQDAVTREAMKIELLKLQAKFPVQYKESYKRKDKTPHFWCCSLQEECPLDDILCLSVEFQVTFNEEKVHKDFIISWDLISAWMLQKHGYDMKDASTYDVKLITSRQNTTQGQLRVTQPRFYVTYNAKNIEELSQKCYILGMLHGNYVRLSAKEAPQCDNGFDFKFYCTLFDPKVTAPRPSSLKPVFQRVLKDLTPKTDSGSILKSFLLSHEPPKGEPIRLEWLKSSSDLSIIEKMEETVEQLKKEGILAAHPAHSDVLMLTSKFMPWKPLRLYLTDQSVASIQFKDCGIWIDQSFGLPQGAQVMQYRCFSIHVATAFSLLNRSEISPWQLEDYMQYRYRQFKLLHHHLQSNQAAMRTLQQKYRVAKEAAKGSEIDPDYLANPAFWANVNTIKELAENAGDDPFTSIWSFMFLPTEFQQFHYLVVNTRPHEDSSGIRSVKIVNPCWHFISEKQNANTIVVMYQGGQYGHFSSLLFPRFNPNQKETKKDDIKRKIIETCADNSIQIRFKKDCEAMWKPLADVFRDLSLQDYQQGKREQITISFPDSELDKGVVVIDESSQEAHTPAKGQEEGAGAEADVDGEDVACDGGFQEAHTAAEGQTGGAGVEAMVANEGSQKAQHNDPEDSDQTGVQDKNADATGTKQQQKLAKRIDNVRRTISVVHDMCNEADEFSLITPEDIDFKDLEKHVKRLSALVSQAQLSLQGCIPLGQECREKQGHLMNEFDSLGSLIQVVVDLRDKFNRVKSSKQRPNPKRGKASAAQSPKPAPPATGPMDLFFKVRSIMPADDVSDQISDNILAELFRIEPTPTFIASFYYSLVRASCQPDIQVEMEAIFKQQLFVCKSCASSLCEQTRSQFSQVENNSMIRGGKTFREYLAYKQIDSWDKVGFDNVLGEVTLCSQIWKLNIALIWRHGNLWRLFVAAHGGKAPIIAVLYAKTKVTLDSNGEASFSAGTARRFFPLIPTSEDWFESSIFQEGIPESVPVEPEPQPIVQFRKHIDKEFTFQSRVECEDPASPDETSECTADVPESELWDSFVDDEAVSQGSLPTPPEIRAIPLPQIVHTINESMALPLRAIRKRRVVISSDDEAQHVTSRGSKEASRGSRARGRGGTGARAADDE